MINCLACGNNSNPDDAIFCTRCGERLEAAIPPQASPTVGPIIDRDDRARRILGSHSQGSQPYIENKPPVDSRQQQLRARPLTSQSDLADKWCPVCRIWNRPDVESCVACGGALETGAQRTNSASHTLVWICAFVPLAGLAAELALANAGRTSWWVFIPMIIANWILLGIDETKLAKQGYNVDRLKGLTVVLVPVYLFKRVSVAGGGYGYGVLWVACFSAALLVPFAFTSGFSAGSQTIDNTYLHTDFAYSDGNRISFIILFRDENGESVQVEGDATISVIGGSGKQQSRFNREVTQNTYQQYQNSLTHETFSAVELSVPYSGGPIPSIRLRFEADGGYWEDIEIPVLPRN